MLEPKERIDLMVDITNAGKKEVESWDLPETSIEKGLILPPKCETCGSEMWDNRNNKLSKNFVEAIASQWKRSNIETVEAAMEISKQEHKQKSTYIPKTVNRSIRAEDKPVWLYPHLSNPLNKYCLNKFSITIYNNSEIYVTTNSIVTGKQIGRASFRERV